MKPVQIAWSFGSDTRHQRLGGDAFGLGLEHDRCAMGIVGTNEMHLMAGHALRTHPDIGLDVFHDVPDMERTIGIGQGGGDKQAARFHGATL